MTCYIPVVFNSRTCFHFFMMEEISKNTLIDILRPPGGGFIGRSAREPSSDSELLVGVQDGLSDMLSEGIRAMKLAFLGLG